ncbi:MerR family transcriptional regulator [bacterium]|nr:MerR family transcriptional regulator [bacterium]
MQKAVFTQEEILSKINVSDKLFSEWQKKGFIKAVGRNEDNNLFFTQDTLEKTTKIQKLAELGFTDEDIKKIIKKIGLPQKKQTEKEKDFSKNFLTVGDLADKIGVSPRTIKHWEDKGIIEPDMRSEGGFRLYAKSYVYICNLIQDLQLFGYTLEEIKTLSDYFREFLDIKNDYNKYNKTEANDKLENLHSEVEKLFLKISQLKEGIHRWEDLLKKKKKEISSLKTKNNKRNN